MKKKMMIIILGIIFVIIIGGAMFKSYDNNLQVKANLKEDMEQLSKGISDAETRISDVKGFHNDVDKLDFQNAIDTAKEAFEDPSHTSLEVYNSTLDLSSADRTYESTTLTEMPIETIITSTEATSIDTSTSTNNDEQIWQYCVDRWEYYDILEGKYSADKHTDDVFNDGSTRFGISASEVQATWDKVDKVKNRNIQLKQ